MDMNNMSDQEKRETIKEAKILEALKHPNIIRFREVYKTKKGKLCICMDYADGNNRYYKTTLSQTALNFYCKNSLFTRNL